MTETELLNFYFKKENEIIDEFYYDPKRNETDIKNNILLKFDMYKINPHNPYGKRSPALRADGAGHYKSCPFYVLEVKKTDLDKAIEQLKSTVSYINEKERTVSKLAIITDTEKWNTKLRNFYRIDEEQQLYIKEDPEYQVKINEMPVLLFTEDFKKYNVG